MTRLQVSVATTLDSVGPERWRQVAAGLGLYLSYPWLRMIEDVQREQADIRYVLVSRDDELLGALPTYLYAKPPADSFYDPVRQFLFPPEASFLLPPGNAGGESERYAEWYPVLLGGSVSAFANHLVVRRSLSAELQREVVECLVSAFLDRMRQSGARSAAFMYLFDSSVGRVRHLLPAASFVTFLGARARIHPPAGGFDRYIQALPGSYRHVVRKEVRRFSRSLKLHRYRLGQVRDELPALLAALQRKYGHAADEREVDRSLSLQAQHLDRHSVVLCAEADGRIVGTSLSYDWEGVVFVRTAGFDYPALPGAYEYFNLVMYGPVHYAQEKGLQAVDLGVGALPGKVSRGARLTPVRCLVIPPRSLGDDLAYDLAVQAATAQSRWQEDNPFSLGDDELSGRIPL